MDISSPAIHESDRLNNIKQNPNWIRLAYLVLLLALAIYVGYFLIYSFYAFSLFNFPFDYDQGEGFELVDTLMFSQFEWPYQSNDEYPFYSSNYPPVFHLVVVPLVWIFGPEYWTGRMVAYLGTLLTAGAIGYAVQHSSRRWWLSALAGLAFLASNYIYRVGPLFRQHMFMVMFETLAVVTTAVVVERFTKDTNRDRRGLIIVMLLLLLAGYTKQLAYATVAAVFAFLFIRQAKVAVFLAVPFGIVTGTIFILIDLATDGQWLTNAITANLNPFNLDQGIALFKQWFSLHLMINLVAVAYVAFELYIERLSVYSIWFVFAAANGLTAGKWGAGESYFATAIAASCILGGIGLGRVVNWGRIRSQLGLALTVMSIGLLFLFQANRFFHMPTHTDFLAAIPKVLGKPTATFLAPQTSCSPPRPVANVPYVDSAGLGLLGRPPTNNDVSAGKKIAAKIAEGNTPAFSEEAGFNLYLGRDVITNPTQLLNLYNNNRVDLSEMLAMLDNQEFDTVVFRAQFYPPPVLEVIGQRYETTELIEMNGFVYCLMEPRGNNS